MSEAYPDEDWLDRYFEDDDDEPVEIKPWYGLYFQAWDALRWDRPYGAMGGEMPISYLAISQYARDHNITGNDLWIFERLFGALDTEWLKFVAERLKARE